MRTRPRLLLALLVCACIAPGCADPPPRHAVLVVIDTLRADMLAAADTPHLDALAESGPQPKLVWSSGTWTAPSVISLFTGEHVRGHGWDEDHRGPRGLPPLPSIPTLAEVLAEQGFMTTGLYANVVLSWKLGFRRGFDRWERLDDPEIPGRVAKEVASWQDGSRHFLYLHLMGPHASLAPSREARGRWGLDGEVGSRIFNLSWARRQRSPEGTELATHVYRKAYTAVVEDTDVRIGQIVRALGPHLEDSVLVVTSDHGEMLGELGRFGHRSWLHEALNRVPLIAVNGGPVPERMTIAAVPDLITRALGIEHRWAVRAEAGEPLVTQREGKFAISSDGRVKGSWTQHGGFSVVDLAGYPKEPPGPARRESELREARTRFDQAVAPGRADGERILPDAETLDQLRRLGYLEEVDED